MRVIKKRKRAKLQEKLICRFTLLHINEAQKELGGGWPLEMWSQESICFPWRDCGAYKAFGNC